MPQSKSKIVDRKNHPEDTEDNTLKDLFAFPKVIEDLLKGFVPKSWVKDLDFNRLKPLNVKHSSANSRTRESDIIWKIPFRDEMLYLIFLLEFQSESHEFMSLRILTYAGLILEDVIKKDKLNRNHTLPPIFPLVFYTGEAKWKAPLSLREHYPKGLPVNLWRYQPNITYFLLEISRLKVEDASLISDNIVSHLVGIENSRELTELYGRVKQAIQTLKGSPESQSLLRYLLRASKINKRFDRLALHPLREDPSMLVEKIERLENEFKEQCRAEGKIEGQIKAQQSFLGLLLTKRFGQVSGSIQNKMQSASSDQLQQWIKQILNDDNVSELMN